MRTETRQSYEERLKELLVFIMDNLDRPMPVEDLAHRAYFSKFHFHRVFQGMMGESVADFVRRMRLERAAQELRLPDKPVTEIAFDAGYATHEAFTKAFRGAFDAAPSSFRKTRSDWSLSARNGVHFVSPGAVYDLMLSDTGGRKMEVEIKKVAPMRVAAMRHIGPYEEIGPVFGKLMQWAYGSGIQPGPIIAIYHDNPQMTPASELKSDACFVVDPGFTTDAAGVRVVDLPDQTCACTLFKGPYQGLGQAWGQFIGEWLPNSGYEMDEARVCFEKYLNTPMNAAPEDLLTELYQPLKV